MNTSLLVVKLVLFRTHAIGAGGAGEGAGSHGGDLQRCDTTSSCLFRLEDSLLCSVLCFFNHYNHYVFLLNDLHPRYIQYYTMIERCVSFACCFVAAAGKMVIHKGGKASGFKNKAAEDT